MKRSPLLFLTVAVCAAGFAANRVTPVVTSSSVGVIRVGEESSCVAGADARLAFAPPHVAASSPIVIHGVQPYALDQPRVPACLQPSEGEPPLSVHVEELGSRVFAIDAFLDTGSSRVTLSQNDSRALGVLLTGEVVEDLGIGGKEAFEVAASCVLRAASSSANSMDVRQFMFAVHCSPQVRRRDPSMMQGMPFGLRDLFAGHMSDLDMGENNLDEMLRTSINIIGMPFIERHVVVLDPRPVVSALNALANESGGEGNDPLDQLLEEMETSGGQQLGRMKVDLLTPAQSYPQPRISIPLKLVDMDPGNLPVTKAHVPFIPGVSLQHGGARCQGDFLLDTGGGISLLSPSLARQLGLDLSRAPLTAQVQGVGAGHGGLKGFWIDALTITSQTGPSVTFTKAPMFVADIAGIAGSMGMNFFGPSVFMDLGQLDMSNPTAILGSLRPGPLPFRRIIIDTPRKRLGLDPV
ncbi:MAG: hypothetical protein GW893_21580 [Armatimonadetes bacterium]|nr:hypothetical protein [Armatimonadota bacterium]PIU60281.1 MAG: hypothetical protein COS85_25295 [Armatimonadetes bacterium CG07_land_8_20_14_0_80_59_28]PIX41121.1 MAG: hypothetical protein COZ56_12905 [Armatimonadetes bacterium CG_4_8_14_3_um_filter_58_9]PIY46967.1 MAG: hypothetical protein COZ05_05455 [Armatimonadetes bacterium CG_4_10_14_3_um_filter_59_10]PJB72159.1 MAG: hypothetical protein CO095_07220 [Armatimonadetes bacterium CG_4_9_14_3_um_filter_58_7]